MDTTHNPQHLTNPPTPPRYTDPDEINLLEYVYVLVKHKTWIIGLTLLGLVAGYIAAQVKGPSWVSEAVIAPKDSDVKKAPNLAGLGALGGLVASQMDLGGNPGLDKIDLALSSRKFNAELISRFDLLPTIYKVAWPKAFRKSYEEASGKWRSDFLAPDSLGMGSFLKSTYLKKEIKTAGNTMTLTVKSPDSAFTNTLINTYLRFLDSYIRSTVQTQAKTNVAYLDSLLVTIVDPLVREKMQGMIASEIEKSMLVANEAFQVVDPPYQSKQFKEKKLYPLVFGAGLFFMSVLVIVFLHAFSSSEKTEEDRNLIAGIKRELRRIV